MKAPHLFHWMPGPGGTVSLLEVPTENTRALAGRSH